MSNMYRRYAETQIRTALSDTPAVAVIGPRQSGKSTLVRKIAGTSRPYLTFDNPTLLAAARRDPEGFVRNLDRAIIDEIQRAPEIVLALKQSIDENRRPGRFLLTGSAHILAIPKAQESLAGRMEVVPLLPLAQGEILNRKPPRFIDDAFKGRLPQPISTKDIMAVVLSGGYPDVLLRKTDRRRRDWCRAYVKAIEQRDIHDIAPIDRAARVPRLVEILAHHAGQLVNLSAIGGQIGLDAKTVDRYTHLLENLFVLQRVRPWWRNELKRLVATPKIHFLDSGLLSAVLNLDRKRFRLDRTSFGPVLESFVFAELSKAAALSTTQCGIFHYRDKDQVEVDFILENELREIVAIEVKSAVSVTGEDFKGLERLKHHVGDAFRLGVVLHDGNATVPFGPRLFAAPLSVLWS